jgi:hypothetical protein
VALIVELRQTAGAGVRPSPGSRALRLLHEIAQKPRADLDVVFAQPETVSTPEPIIAEVKAVATEQGVRIVRTRQFDQGMRRGRLRLENYEGGGSIPVVEDAAQPAFLSRRSFGT